MGTLLPEGLNNSIATRLNECVTQARKATPDELVVQSSHHLEAARLAHSKDPLVDIQLAEALHVAITRLFADWDRVPRHVRPWCKGMVAYFVSPTDDQHDWRSCVGFDDDAEVINACLRMADREDLCVNPEETDGAG